MRASGPTAWPAHASAHLVNSNLDAALLGGFLLGRGDPADPLVARQRGNLGPKVPGGGIQLDGLPEICRQFVNGAVRKFLSGHSSKRDRFNHDSPTPHSLIQSGFLLKQRNGAFSSCFEELNWWAVSGAKYMRHFRNSRHFIALPNFKQLPVLEWRYAARAIGEHLQRRPAALAITVANKTTCRQCDHENERRIFHGCEMLPCEKGAATDSRREPRQQANHPNCGWRRPSKDIKDGTA
jgi:hypothetical protein